MTSRIGSFTRRVATPSFHPTYKKLDEVGRQSFESLIIVYKTQQQAWFLASWIVDRPGWNQSKWLPTRSARHDIRSISDHTAADVYYAWFFPVSLSVALARSITYQRTRVVCIYADIFVLGTSWYH